MEDVIGFDSKLPGGGVVVTGEGNGRVPVEWSGFEDKHSGVVGYILVHDSKPMRSCDSGTVAYQGAGSSSTVTGLTNGTTYYFGVCAVDEAGNTGRVRRVQGRPATAYDAPTGSVLISDGAQSVGPGRTEVSISAFDASGVARMCVRASKTCTKWTDFETTASLSVGTSHREITGRVWLQDGQGNITSTPLSDTVFVDARRPSDGAVSASARSGGMRLVASGYADADSGVTEYIVTGRTAGRKGPPACGSNTVLYRGSGATINLSGLASGTEMKFRVCAVDAVGNISRGTVVTATPN
jgi:hypothetical protein